MVFYGYTPHFSLLLKNSCCAPRATDRTLHLFSFAPLFFAHTFLRAAPRRGHRLHFTLPAPLPDRSNSEIRDGDEKHDKPGPCVSKIYEMSGLCGKECAEILTKKGVLLQPDFIKDIGPYALMSDSKNAIFKILDSEWWKHSTQCDDTRLAVLSVIAARSERIIQAACRWNPVPRLYVPRDDMLALEQGVFEGRKWRLDSDQGHAVLAPRFLGTPTC